MTSVFRADEFLSYEKDVSTHVVRITIGEHVRAVRRKTAREAFDTARIILEARRRVLAVGGSR